MSTKEAGNGVIEFLANNTPERFKDGFYGYVIASFLIVNWENIVLIIKSKNDIELTLIYIYAQKDFAYRFLWMPIIYGMAAAFVMPIIVAIYNLYMGLFNSIKQDSTSFGNKIWAIFKMRVSNEQQKQVRRLMRARGSLNTVRSQHDQLVQDIAARQIQKDNFDQFLKKVDELYYDHHRINSPEDFIKLFEHADQLGIFEHYRGQALLRVLKKHKIVKETKK
ncbi:MULTISPECIES: hypothetical protein [Citrobacter]|uniref:hypothetical protein n=1 Tax=Citrobacter TaxID=544 RepID=UPI001BCDD5F9|nr:MULTISPECIES: hypothetical protein [Citrobacter]MCK2155622.1 hypothetical protein [Citrobacter braakii]MDM2743186.1 hypothetical protein [Citrobacter sp. Cu231]